MKLILHIGLPKTGSTAIQRVLTDNRERLGREGILYPALDQYDAQHVLQAAIWQKPVELVKERAGFSADAAIRDSEAAWDRLFALVDAERPKKLILSSEVFGFRLTEGARDAWHDRLHRMADDITVVAYLRAPIALAASQIQQNLKKERFKPPISLRPDFEIVDGYARALGKDKLVLRVFDRNTLKDGDVVSDFLDVCGVSLDLDRSRATGANESLSAEAMCLLQSYGRPHRAQSHFGARLQTRVFNHVAAADRKVEGATKPKWRPDVRNALAAMSQDARKLRDEYGVVFPGMDYGEMTEKQPSTSNTFSRIEQMFVVDASRLQRLRRKVPVTTRKIAPILAHFVR